MSKYIVKSCPKYRDKLCVQEGFCENITDCKVKQIIDKCKEATDFCTNCRKDADYQIDCIDCFEGGRSDMAHDILRIFELEPFQTPEFLAKLKGEVE